jgi:organic radical activating enzyme
MVIPASQSRDTSTGSRLERTFALGLGLTNECNLACSFCYRDPTRVDRLSLEQVRAVMKSLPVRSVNLGTGENGMHPDFKMLVAYLRCEPIKLTITSNGYSIEALEDSQISAFQDVEFRSTIRPRRSKTDNAARVTGISSTDKPRAAARWACR